MMKFKNIKKSVMNRHHKYFFDTQQLNTRKYHFAKAADTIDARSIDARVLKKNFKRVFIKYINNDIEIDWSKHRDYWT